MINKSSLLAIENAKVVTERGIILDGVIIAKDGYIVDFGKRGKTDIPTGAQHLDAHGAYVGPGFVDIHVHGGGGFHTGTEPREAARHFLSHGETAMLATPSKTGTLQTEEICELIGNIRAAMPEAKNIKGIYMEGPYYNGNFGANRHLNIWGDREITSEDYTRLVNAGGKDVKVWMIAPEREGLIPFMKYAREVNPEVKFAFGHCKATPEEIRALGKYRPTIQTHSMNATGRTPHTNGLRAWGPDEYAFMEPEVYCELISDSLGIHVNREMQQLLLHTKGLHRVILITDSTNYNNPIPEKFAHVTDLNFDPKGGIAGSRLTMDAACRNIMAHTNCGIAEAFILAAGNPARAIGMDDEIGSIERGKRCDLVFVDDIFNVKEVILGGEICDI